MLYYIEPISLNSQTAHANQIRKFCSALRDEIDTSLLCFDTEEIGKKPKLFQKLHPYSSIYLRHLIKKIKFQKDDIVFTRDPYLAHSLRNKCKYVILEMHEITSFTKNPIQYLMFDFWLQINPLKKIGKSNNIKVFAISSKLVQELKDDFRINAQILHDAVDVDYYNLDISREEARRKLLLKDETIISYVGSTSLDRDLKTLIELAKINPNLTFLIYGKINPQLKSLAAETTNVKLMGYTTDTNLVYKASDILFAGYTKRVKTIDYMSPLKLFEYLASKTPTVVADFPRNREITNENECFFYESENVESLNEIINQILRNPELANERALKGFNKVKKNTWQKRAKFVLESLK